VNSVIVFGGYGVFGSHVARELARAGITVTVAGRSLAQAQAFARTLGSSHGALEVDLASAPSCQHALRGQAVAVNCAGSLVDLGPELLEACLQLGCHYTDIIAERSHVALIRAYHTRFVERGLVAVFGASSLPAISGALALLAAAAAPERPQRARVTLFIGNRNAKGRAAIASLVALLGQPLAAPQGIVLGFREREVVRLPAPFGDRAVFNFDSPEYDLFPNLLGVRSVSVKMGFESRLATYGFALLARLGWRLGRRTVNVLEPIGRWFSWTGGTGGAVMIELFYCDGNCRRAAILARRDGQRMAALPCALAAQALCADPPTARGVLTAYEFLGAERLLEQLVERGFELVV
jgi:NAD(P)-dependent dehydrogenase (short-subunit alcohol dehydrogenase family)